MKPKELKALRAKLGDSQQEFATRMGCSLSVVSKWETGASTPKGIYADKLQEIKNYFKR